MDNDRRDGEPGPDAPTGSDPSGTEDDRVEDPPKLPSHIAAALCYLLSFATGVVFLLLEPEDRLVRFHAFQSILLGAVALILLIGIWILSLVPLFGWVISTILMPVVVLAWVLVSMFAMFRALQGESYQLPYLGPRATRLASPY